MFISFWVCWGTKLADDEGSLERRLERAMKIVESRPSGKLPVRQVKVNVDDIITKGKAFGTRQPYLFIGWAMRDAMQFAGVNGYLATIPELIGVIASYGLEHDIFRGKDYFIGHTERIIGIDKKGLFYKKGDPVLAIVNGGGNIPSDVLDDVTKFMIKNYDGDKDRIKDFRVFGVASFSHNEFVDILKGELSDGDIEMHSYEDIERGVSNLPHRFGVVMPYSLPFKHPYGDRTIFNKREFLQHPLVIASNGGHQNLEEYFERIKDYGNNKTHVIEPLVAPIAKAEFINKYIDSQRSYFNTDEPIGSLMWICRSGIFINYGGLADAMDSYDVKRVPCFIAVNPDKEKNDGAVRG